MMIFREVVQDAQGRPVVQEAARMGLRDGHLWVSGAPRFVELAQQPLALPFGGEVDPRTEPQRFLDSLPMVFHGTYSWVEQESDDTPPVMKVAVLGE